MFSIGLAIIPSFITLVIGYFLGVKQTKKQVLSKYITEIAGKNYPDLFSEIKDQLERLDRYLNEPNGNFSWAILEDIYNSGLERFIEKHHKNLFCELDSFQKNIIPKFSELDILFMALWEKTFPTWSEYLEISLPKPVNRESKKIAHDLSKSINPHYVLPDLLNERYEISKEKIVDCIASKTTHFFQQPTEYILRQGLEPKSYKYPQFEIIAESMIEKIKPITTNLIEKQKELKKISNTEIKMKLLPLLKECISNPI